MDDLEPAQNSEYCAGLYTQIYNKDCQAQANYDSLKQKILKMDMPTNTIHSNISQSHKGFQVGTIMIIAGVIVTSVGIQVVSNKAINGIHMIYGGLALTIMGYDIRMAHKWVKERKD